MFTSSTATNLAQQHHLPSQIIGNSHANQQQQLSHHQPQHGNQQLSIGQNFASQPLFSLAHQNHLAHQQAPQFLDSNQHLVAQFSHQTAALTNSHFADGLSVADASQFVSVMQQQQQQNQQLQNGGVFNPAAFFQQHHSSNSGASQHLQSNHSSHQQQLTCANVMSTSAASVDNLNLASASQVILDSTGNGLLRLHNGTSIVNGDQPSLAVSSISDLRQQPRAPASGSNSGNNCTNGNNNRSNSIDSNFNASKLMTNHCSSINTNTNNNSSITTSNSNTNDNNNYTSNTKSSSKSKSNGNNKKDKSESRRDSESPRRTFACPTCGKGFTEKFNMKRHMQIHSQSRPKHICNECLKSFAWKDNFIRHRKAAHGNNIQQYQV